MELKKTSRTLPPSTCRLPGRHASLAMVLLALFTSVGCTYDPLLYSGEAPGEIDNPSMAAAAIEVLQRQGYTIALINETTGTVTTRWSDATGTLGHLFEVSSRKRVMVSVALDGLSVSVQMTKQEFSESLGWTNSPISRKDRRETQRILDQILSRPIYL